MESVIKIQNITTKEVCVHTSTTTNVLHDDNSTVCSSEEDNCDSHDETTEEDCKDNNYAVSGRAIANNTLKEDDIDECDLPSSLQQQREWEVDLKYVIDISYNRKHRDMKAQAKAAIKKQLQSQSLASIIDLQKLKTAAQFSALSELCFDNEEAHTFSYFMSPQ